MSPCCTMTTPVGRIRLTVGDQGLTSLSWCEEGGREQETDDPRLISAREELHQYFCGELKTFTVKVDFSRWSGFAAQVYTLLATIPYGKTMTYGELARLAGSPSAARAVGRIMASNPLPIILPCHRVIAASGAMTGYSGGEGISTKVFLLDLEKVA